VKIGFIGAGKVGFTLGKYFRSNKIDVAGYYSRSYSSAKEAADFTNSQAFDTIEAVLSHSDVLFLTSPDSAILPIFENLKTYSKTSTEDKIICHCSGALSFDGIYCVHPFLAISSKLESHKEMNKAFFTLEGNNPEHIQVLKNLIEGMGNQAHVISSEDKVKYHAAACFMSNMIAGLVNTGSELMRECGFSDELITSALQTLFINHCEAISINGTVNTLVGPVDRNDVYTVKKHLSILDKSQKKLYTCLLKQLIEIAKLKNPTNNYSEMEQLL
jgi:predicted short-subunit dehydrogenase-like oxidoreductase (DUF2520 family)